MNRKILITFITPCFCRGADCSPSGLPEIRPPSIRGQFHWWFRALGGSYADESAIFGSVHGEATASKLVVRVLYPLTPRTEQSPTLPHKSGGPASPKQAVAVGEAFDLMLSSRLGGLTSGLEAMFSRALDAWLHMGALGLRATRSGGNFSWEGQPDTPEAYQAAVDQIIRGSPLRAVLLDQDYQSSVAARKDITNTLADQAFGHAATLGKAIGGRRKTSPLRLRVVRFSSGVFRILAVWDGRTAVTGNTARDLEAAIETLAAANKPLGLLLRQARAALS